MSKSWFVLITFIRHLKYGAKWALLPTLSVWIIELLIGSKMAPLLMLMMFFAIFVVVGWLLSYVRSRGWLNRKSP